MFHPCASSSSSSYSNSPSNQPSSSSSSSAFLFDANSALFLPSYFASSSPHHHPSSHAALHVNDSKDLQGHEVSTGARASRYSPEERKERIERYRSKRNLRNFQKKITYECRKTLADSRPRVRGRFAKNAETESETDTADSSNGSYYGLHNGLQDTGGSANADASWWRMEAELMSADTFEAESKSYYDDELWAQLVSDFSANV